MPIPALPGSVRSFVDAMTDETFTGSHGRLTDNVATLALWKRAGYPDRVYRPK